MKITDLEGNRILSGITDHDEILATLKNEGTIKSINDYMIDEDMPGTYVVTNGIEEVAIIYD